MRLLVVCGALVTGSPAHKLPNLHWRVAQGEKTLTSAPNGVFPFEIDTRYETNLNSSVGRCECAFLRLSGRRDDAGFTLPGRAHHWCAGAAREPQKRASRPVPKSETTQERILKRRPIAGHPLLW